MHQPVEVDVYVATIPMCPTCDEPWPCEASAQRVPERRAPVQGIVLSDPFERIPAGTISWAEHEEAWLGYQKRWPASARDQDATRIAERGGFGYKEVCDLLGHKPTTWKTR